MFPGIQAHGAVQYLDAFTLLWSSLHAYIFLPFALIQKNWTKLKQIRTPSLEVATIDYKVGDNYQITIRSILGPQIDLSAFRYPHLMWKIILFWIGLLHILKITNNIILFFEMVEIL